MINIMISCNYQKCQMSWLDQRQMMYHAVEALGNHPVVSDIIKEVKQIQPKLPTLDGEYICCGKSRSGLPVYRGGP